MINCPYCGKLTDPKLENCPHCGGPMRAKPVESGRRPGITLQHCPNCGSPVQDGDIICVRCGTNLLTGQKIVQEQKAPPPARRRPWKLIAGGVVAVAAVVALVTLAVLLFTGDAVAQARELNAQGNLLEALNVLQAHLARHPNDEDAHMLMGELYWQAQQYPNAAEAFGKAASLDTRNADAPLYQALALSKAGNDSNAGQLEALRKAVDADPSNGNARFLLALAQGASGQYDAQIQTLAALPEASVQELRPAEATGIAHAMQGNSASAQEQLSRAAAETESGDAQAALGFVAYESGNMDEALQAFDKALQQGTSIAPLVRARAGMIRLGRGETDAALPLLREASKQENAPPEATFYYALALSSSGQTPEAMQELEQIASGTTDFAGAAATELAAIYLRQGDAAHAEENLRRAQQSGQTSAKLATLQGQLQALNGQPSDAHEAYRRALQLDANYAPAHLEQGLLYIQQEAIPDGIAALQRYLELAPQDPALSRRNEIQLLVDQLRQTMQS